MIIHYFLPLNLDFITGLENIKSMKIFLFFLTFFFLIHLSAQETPFKNRVGINAGFTTGLGFTYGYWPGRFGAQLSVFPAISEDFNLISLAVTPFYTLKEKKYFKSYIFLGNHIVSDTKITEYNIGIGPGFEFGKRLVFSLRFGMGFFDVTNTFNILPTLETGLFFKF